MKRRNNNKSKRPSFGFLKVFFFIAAFGFMVYVFTEQTVKLLKASPHFIIRQIEVDPTLKINVPPEVSYLIGKNIFNVNLRALHKKIVSQHPELAHLKISKKYPDKIYIMAKKRTVLAQARINGRLYALDQAGVVLKSGTEPEENLPLLLGVRVNTKVSVGEMLKGPDIRAGLGIIKAFENDPKLAAFPLNSVDVQNTSKINLLVSEKLKVLMDTVDFQHKIRLLGFILSQPGFDWNTTKYIDLRFKEPILGTK